MPAVRRTSYMRPMVGQLLSVDTETTGLRVHKGHRPFLYNFANDQGETLILKDDLRPQADTGMYRPEDDASTGPVRQLVRAWMADAAIQKVFHNSKFDLRMMRAFGIEVVGRVDDTMVMGHILSAFGIVGKDFGFQDDQKDVPVLDLLALDRLAAKYLNERKDPGPANWIAEHPTVGDRPANYSDVPDEVMLPYAAQDVVLTMKLYYMMNEHLDKLALRRRYEDEIALIRDVVIPMEQRGSRLDVPFMRGRVVELREIRTTSLATLRTMVKPIVVVRKKVRSRNKVKREVRCWTSMPVEEINFNSDKQCIKILQGQFGLRTSEFTKTGQMKMSERLLTPLKHPFAQELVRYQRAEKLLGTYYEGYLSRANGDILHPNYLTIGTLTGRFSSRDPNLQNLPTEHGSETEARATGDYRGVKRAFIPRDGFTNYHADYSQIEMKCMAHFAEDPRIDKAVQERDIHTEITKLLYGEIADPKEFEYKRAIAKVVSFGILYGMSRKTFMWKLQVDALKMQGILDHYFNTFPGIRRFQQETIRQVRETGQVRNMFGRRYLVDPRVAYRAVNYQCQGSAADLLKCAMLKVQKMLVARQARSALLLQIHDEIVFEVHESEDKWLPREVVRILQDVPECRLPITASLERADGNWENLNKVCMRCGASTKPKEDHQCPPNGRWLSPTSGVLSTLQRLLPAPQ